jgi:hypothetical protein
VTNRRGKKKKTNDMISTWKERNVNIEGKEKEERTQVG